MNEENTNEISRRIKINRKSTNARNNKIPTEAQIYDMILGIRRKCEVMEESNDNLININDIEGRNKCKRVKTCKKKKKMTEYERENKREEKKRKKEGSGINENESEIEVLKETKRSISESEDIRRFFRTEDKH